jgi:hypothetical protein
VQKPLTSGTKRFFDIRGYLFCRKRDFAMSIKDILEELRTKPSVSVPTAGAALAGLSKNASYLAAREGRLGVPVFMVGGRRRVPSIAILKQLGLADDGGKAA